MKITGNEPAFPIVDEATGLTIRQHFAAMAMQTIKEPEIYIGKEQTETSFKKWARKCVKMSDALIEELNK